MNLDSIKFCHLGVTLFRNLAIMPLQWRSWPLETLRTSFRCEKVSLSYHVCLHHWQCAIPTFEDLLPQKHDRIMQKLLFELATLHGLAKLWLHTESTLNDLENSATQLGNLLQTFKTDVCSEYATRDLPSEEAVLLFLLLHTLFHLISNSYLWCIDHIYVCYCLYLPI